MLSPSHLLPRLHAMHFSTSAQSPMGHAMHEMLSQGPRACRKVWERSSATCEAEAIMDVCPLGKDGR